MKNTKFIFGAMALSLLVAACGGQATPAPAAPPIKETVLVTVPVPGEPKKEVVTATPAPSTARKMLRINLGAYPDIIDPQKSSFSNEIAMLSLMYEGLTRFDEKLNTVPGSAEKWEYSKDATELTFTLRKGLKYSDGSLLNARRFEYAILRNINPATNGEYRTITDEIAGAEAWRENSNAAAAEKDAAKKKDLEDKAAKSEAAARASVQALDASGQPCKDYAAADCLTLKIKLGKPAPYFHTIMGMWVTFPAKEENIVAGKDQWWNSSKFQVGNGSYVLKSLDPFVRAIYMPNPNYYRGVGKVDIEMSFITDSAVYFQAYKNNEFDVIPLAAEDLKTARADAVLAKEVNIYPGSCTQALFMHNLKEPFTDPKVREAFAYALKRDDYVAEVLRGLGSPALSWIPKGYPGYQEGETRFGFNMDAAKKAIAESKYGSVDKLPKITAQFSDTPRNRVRWEWIAAKYKENLGVSIELKPVEPTAYSALTKDQKTAPQMYLLGWCADYPDPQNWLSVYWKTGAFGERIGYGNKEFDALVNEADTQVDAARRAELYKKAQDMLVSQQPIAFFYNTVNSYLIKPGVQGMKFTPQDASWPGYIDPLSIEIK